MQPDPDDPFWRMQISPDAVMVPDAEVPYVNRQPQSAPKEIENVSVIASNDDDDHNVLNATQETDGTTDDDYDDYVVIVDVVQLEGAPKESDVKDTVDNVQEPINLKVTNISSVGVSAEDNIRDAAIHCIGCCWLAQVQSFTNEGEAN